MIEIKDQVLKKKFVVCADLYDNMARPRSTQRNAKPSRKWKHLILDGYIDEPASLGVPPFIAPQVRSLAGGLLLGGAEEESIGYMTVDQWRQLRGNDLDIDNLDRLNSLILIAGCVVPGKYLRGNPVSPREASELFSVSRASLNVITGAASNDMAQVQADIHEGDTGVLGEGIASQGRIISRDRTMEQWQEHLVSGSFIVEQHPDHPSPLICEIETSRGCPRFISGGCSFCMEPGKGPVQFRTPEEVAMEITSLAAHGVENIRIGGQSDLISYLSKDVGRYEVPEPDVGSVADLMMGAKEALHDGMGVRRAVSEGRRIGIESGIVHTDNANPAVISSFPDASKEALQAIIDGSTSGTVLALGLESSDPKVRIANNLNSTGEQTFQAVSIMNEVGKGYGENGLPRLLPGINFLGGLPGQEDGSYSFDLELLKRILDSGLCLRRINIRKAIFPSVEQEEHNEDRPAPRDPFVLFKKEVREVFDPVFLERILPPGHIMRGVLVEANSGKINFGRQIGSYPILAGIPHRVTQGSFIDLVITEVSSRSVTGFRTPFDLRKASFRDLTAIPGVGKKRAATVFRMIGKGEKVEKELLNEKEWVMEHIVQ